MAVQSSITNSQFTSSGLPDVATSPLIPLRIVPKAPWIANRDGASITSPDASTYSRNKILSSLPTETRQRLSPHLRRVLLHQDDILHEQGSEIKHVYFVEKGMISLVVDARGDSQIEAAAIGYEGMAGALSALGKHPSVHRAVVQVPGKAYRLSVEVLQNEWMRNPYLQEWILNYSNLLMAQVSQTVLCSRIHSIDERLSRWLLAMRDRIESDHLEITHEYIAQMLGVRRPGVSIALGALQESGLIECGRGQITTKNGKKLENSACECYSTLRRQFQNFESKIGANY